MALGPNTASQPNPEASDCSLRPETHQRLKDHLRGGVAAGSAIRKHSGQQSTSQRVLIHGVLWNRSKIRCNDDGA